jgi:hypothetical protein
MLLTAWWLKMSELTSADSDVIDYLVVKKSELTSADSGAIHFLVVKIVRERLSVSKPGT